MNQQSPAFLEALGFLQHPIGLKCPEDVKTRIALLKVPDDEFGTGTNTGRGGGSSGGSVRQFPDGMGQRRGGGWGSGGGGGSGGGSGGGGGGGNRWGTGGSGGGTGGWGRDSSGGGGGRGGSGSGFSSGYRPSGGWQKPVSLAPTVSNAPPPPSFGHRGGGGGGRGRGGGPRFGNRSRTDATTEDRMMDRIREKMNKFSVLTYDATKAWLSQLLDSGDTEFLTDFITLVFEKASSEPPFCALYAQLLSELCGAFPHLVVELQRIFKDFMSVFVAGEPEVGTAEYMAFVALRERRRFRRGYATFIGEVAKRGVGLTPNDVCQTCGIIIDQIKIARIQEDKGLLCEEYADCLTALVRSCLELIRTGFQPVLLSRVRESMVRTPETVSLTHKARFALMDVSDLFN